MDVDVFWKKFGYLIQAKDGLKKLREIILQLAVMGKLVEQNQKDESACKFLERINSSETITKNKRFYDSRIELPDYLEHLPSGWSWVPLSRITTLITDGSHNPPPKQKSGVPMLSGQNIKKGKINLDASRYLNNDDYLKEIKRTPIEEGDVFLSIVGTIGEAAVVPKSFPKVAIQRSIALIKPLINPAYLCIVFSSPFAVSYYKKYAKGTAQKGIYLGTLSKFLVPLPPLPEQNRIVAKVNQLMEICDQLEINQKNQHLLKIKTIDSAINYLTDKDKANVSKSVSILNKKFSEWFDNLETVECLRSLILQLAIQGKLIPQNPNDEPASYLLHNIKIEKDKLTSSNKTKKTNVKEIKLDNIEPFPLPLGWEWCPLNMLLSKLGAGSTPLGGKQVYVTNGIPFLRSQNIWNEGIKLDDVAFITADTHEKMSGTHVYAGDLLFNITGGSIGRCAIVPDSFLEGNVSQHVTIIRPVFNCLTPYLHLVLVSEYVQKTVMDVQVGVSREGLSIGKLGQFIIPIPPLSEQERIVSKVKELLAICDQLEKNITKANDINVCLMDSLVYGIADIK